ncbi:MAG TPA: protealysin inhibitor emfourin [Leptolyngbya sp.]|jgi:hypothetical protein|nr:protealysin inhibitor emfourin [Leptolyngbya sp.]
MRVTLEQSGGFAGLITTKTIDTQDLSPPEAEQLKRWVKDANFFQLKSIAEASPQPDRFNYTLSVKMDSQTHSIQVSETNVPEKLKPLLNWVQQR